jgi:hypothetical protein
VKDLVSTPLICFIGSSAHTVLAADQSPLSILREHHGILSSLADFHV